MRHILSCFTLVACLLLTGCSSRQTTSPKIKSTLLQQIDRNFQEAVVQYKTLAKQVPPDRFPKTFFPKTGAYEWSNSQWWCSGFYPGSLLYLYEQTGDSQSYSEAKRMLGLLEKEQFNKNTHDLGFMMFCSFGNVNRISPSKEYEQILVNSARSLSSRFNPVTGCIRSWNSKAPDFLVIIDNMMNLELLFWATRATGDSSFYKIALTHANTTMRNHFRADNSSWHVLNYDVETGVVKEKRTAQGFSNESAWARGQAWGLYGFTVMYRETKDPKYLEQANRIAQFMLEHPRMPGDKIPYWDFDTPDIPNALRDASAAAITSSALLELCQYASGIQSKNYIQVAETILQNLSSPHYRAAPGTNGGFLLQHGVGHLPNKSEVDVPLTYADYYFIEAMVRYKNLLR